MAEDLAKTTKPIIPEVIPREQQETLPEDVFLIPQGLLEEAMRQQLCPVEIKICHYFAPGLYLREAHIPAGTMLTSRVHLVQHACVVSAGQITVWGDGVPAAVLEAPLTLIGEAGTRRVGYAHRDTVWMTIWPNPDNERDLEVLLARYTSLPERLLADAPYLGLGEGGAL